MRDNQRFTSIFTFLGIIFISGGMGLKNVFEYAPTIGCLGGFVFFLSGFYFATKARKKN